MNVLIACEESQRVCIEFRKRGHLAFSCDILSCSGGHPEWHIKGDVLKVINGNCSFMTCDGELYEIHCKWDLIIAHPPCTYLAASGAQWFNEDKYGIKAIERKAEREKAAQFFLDIAHANCDRIAIENPVGFMSKFFRKPDQIIQPWWFGDPYEKTTCLWLKGLKKLEKTNPVVPEPRIIFESGRSFPRWMAPSWGKSKEERRKIRSKTFQGFAKAMAEQWGGEKIEREANIPDSR